MLPGPFQASLLVLILTTKATITMNRKNDIGRLSDGHHPPAPRRVLLAHHGTRRRGPRRHCCQVTANAGRALGVMFGCIIGMVPLLFIENNKDEDENVEENESKENVKS